MGIWVRSQDKEELVEVNTVKMFYLQNQGWGIFTNSHVSPNERMCLGYYSTKEKTLKVIDMLEAKIIFSNLYKLLKLDVKELNKITISESVIFSNEIKDLFIFRMPVDKEVITC